MILIGKCSRGGCSTRTLTNNTPKTYKTKCRKGEMFCLSTGKCSQSCSSFQEYDGFSGSQTKTIMKTNQNIMSHTKYLILKIYIYFTQSFFLLVEAKAVPEHAKLKD